MTPPRLDKYQLQLGAQPRRHLMVVRSCDLEPLHQPEMTTRWVRVQSAALVVLLCIASFALIAIASWLGGIL